MKITKYIHSCLLIEEEGKVILIDPGNYSAGVLPIENMQQLDYLLITHEHQDHFDKDLVKQLVAKFPQVKIITTPSVVEQLKSDNIVATSTGDEFITVEVVPHEKVWGPPPQNIAVTIHNKLFHPGDSHSFTHSTEILALPVTAPWGSTSKAVELAQELKPKVIIPIHDAMWTDEARRSMYAWIKQDMAQNGIDFKMVEAGQAIEV